MICLDFGKKTSSLSANLDENNIHDFNQNVKGGYFSLEECF